MEQNTGFMLHLAMAYPMNMPLPRGLYLTTNSWRSGPDEHGWNLSKRDYDAYLNAGLGDGSAKFSSNSYDEDNTPNKLKAVPCLFKKKLRHCPYHSKTTNQLCG